MSKISSDKQRMFQGKDWFCYFGITILAVLMGSFIGLWLVRLIDGYGDCGNDKFCNSVKIGADQQNMHVNCSDVLSALTGMYSVIITALIAIIVLVQGISVYLMIRHTKHESERIFNDYVNNGDLTKEIKKLLDKSIKENDSVLNLMAGLGDLGVKVEELEKIVNSLNVKCNDFEENVKDDQPLDKRLIDKITMDLTNMDL